MVNGTGVSGRPVRLDFSSRDVRWICLRRPKPYFFGVCDIAMQVGTEHGFVTAVVHENGAVVGHEHVEVSGLHTAENESDHCGMRLN